MMKNVFVSAVVASGLVIFTPVANAAVFDFQAGVTANGEQGYDNSYPITLTDSG
jgi:hypothetical protein